MFRTVRSVFNRSIIAGSLILGMLFLGGNASGQSAVWNFTAGTNVASTIPANTSATFDTASIGNSNGTVTGFINTTSPSGVYGGASTTYNIGNAVKIGAFNVSTSSYISLKLIPNAYSYLVISGISFGQRGTGTGPVTYNIRTSADGFASDVATGSMSANSTWALITASSFTTVTGSVGTPIELRIYGSGGTGSPTPGTENWRLDDINITVSAIANFYSKTSTAALNLTSSWGTNTDGSGTNPPDFLTGSQLFHIANNTSGTLSGSWTVSGTGSKIIVDSTNLTIVSSATNTVSGTVDVTAGRTLTLGNSVLPTLGTLDPSSTIKYANGVSNVLNYATTYGNVIFDGSGTGATNPGSSSTLSFAGDFTLQNSATITGGTNITLATKGSRDQTITGNNLTFSIRNLNNNTANAKTGRLTLAANTPMTINNSLILSCSGTANQFSDGGNTLTVLNNVTDSGSADGYNFTGTLTIANTSGTVNIRGNSAGTAAAVSPFNNFTISSNSNSTTASGGAVNFNPVAGGGTTVIKGNLSISALNSGADNIGSVVFNANTIQVGGNLTYSPTGTNSKMEMAAATFVFNGSSTQSFTSPTAFDTFFNVSMIDSSGLTLNKNLIVNGTLTLSRGKISPGSNSVILNSGATVSGGNSASYVSSGLLQKSASGATTTMTFEVGDATGYAPAKFDYASTSGVTLAVKSTAGAHGSLASGSPISYINTSHYVPRYWTISTATGLTSTAINGTFTYATADITGAGGNTNFILRRYNGTGWNSPTSLADNTSGSAPLQPNQTIGTTINPGPVTPVADYVVGDPTCTAVAGTASGTSSAACSSGADTIMLAGGSTGTGTTYQWKSSLDGSTNWTVISLATNATYITGTVSTTKYYHCVVTCALTGFSDSSNNVLFTIDTPPSAGTISGPSTVCAGGTITLTDATGSGVWSSSDISKATVTSGGVVTGVAVGSVTISYTVTSGTCSTSATQSVTVGTSSSAGTISGASSVCVGGLTTLTDGTSGGTWSSTDPSKATVDASGVVTGVAAGSVTISYTVGSGGCAAAATQAMTVNAIPSAGTISGASAVCVGAQISLTDATGSGTWTSSDNTKATVTSSGVVTGVAAGSVTISYAVTTSGCTGYATQAITVNALPSAGSISGPSSTCAGRTITLTDATGSGVWSSTNTLAATVDATGGVTGVGSGSTTISYTVTTSGCSSAATASITVSSLPSAGTISGPSSVCTGAQITLTDATGSGSWTSGDITKATVNSSGVVTGVAAGSVTISYTVTTGCSVSATYAVAINATPSAGVITGASGACIGTSVTLTDTTSGGTWSSSSTSVATVDASGMVTALSTGSSTISYTITSGGCSASATSAFAVGTLPSPGTITGASSVCQFASITLSDTASSGVWSSSDPTIATVSSSGVVSGLLAGTVSISYTVTSGCSASATQSVTVNAAPSSGSISGASAVCVGAQITLTDATGSGSWTSSDNTKATVDASGVVTGVAAGSVTISYTVTSSGCSSSATQSVTVNAIPSSGSISGASAVCVGAQITLTDATGSGSWTSSDNTKATVTSGGVVTGVAAGSVTISYTVTTSGCSSSATQSVTVNALPSAGTISGASAVCVGAQISLTDATGSGSWTSSDNTKATVDASGVVTGVAAGSVTISYTVTSGGCSSSATQSVTVNAIPSSGTISGASAVCVGAQITLTDATGSGSWTSSDNTKATVTSGGVVTGVAAGSVTISYTVTTSGCSSSATQSVTVNALPSAGTISGASAVCVGSQITLTDATGSGSWTSSDNTKATVTSGGVVTGVAAGSVTISYTVTTSGCSSSATQSVTVNALPSAGTITGTTSVSIGSTTTLADATGSGTWTSASTSVATVNSSGVVTGVSAGTSVISYTVTSSGCSSSATATVTVSAGFTRGNVVVASSIGGNNAGCKIKLQEYTTTGTAQTTTILPATGSSRIVISGTATSEGFITLSAERDRLVVVGYDADSGTAAIASSDTITAKRTLGTLDRTATWTKQLSKGIYTGGNIRGGTAKGTDYFTEGSTTGAIYMNTPLTIATSGITNARNIQIYNDNMYVSSGSGNKGLTILNSSGGLGVRTTAGQATSLLLTEASAGGPYSFAISPNDLTLYIASSTTGILKATRASGGATAFTLASGYTASGVVFGTACSGLAVDFSTTNPTIYATTSDGLNLIKLTDAGSTVTSSVASLAIATTTSSVPFRGVMFSPAAYATITAASTSLCAGSSTTLTITANPYSKVVYSKNGVNDSVTLTYTGTTTITTPSTAGTYVYSVVRLVNPSGTTTPSSSVTVTINAYPVLSAISGSTSVCTGSAITLSDTATGGTWTSSNTSRATIVAGTGVLTGVSAGLDTVTYTKTVGVCATSITQPITVVTPPSAGTITGTTTLCASTSVTLTDTAAGGTGVWSSLDPSVATVSSTGVVTGVSAGSTTISYTVTTSCSVSATQSVTITTAASPGSISGATSVCPGSLITLTDTAAGGTGSWTSSDVSKATVSSSGVVTGVAAGSVTISYTITSGGCSPSATYAVTVNALPSAGTITGAAGVCISSTTTLSDAASGGTWSSLDPSTASIDASSGVVSGVALGSTTITYTVTSGGCSSYTTRSITVANPPSAGTITGSTNVCVAATMTLTDTTGSGSWTSSDVTKATVGATGVVTGVASGSATITYTITAGGCSNYTTYGITINPLPATGTISGSATVLYGLTTTLTDATGTGVWSSASTSIATVDASSGAVTGTGGGSTTISYTVTSGAGCMASATFTINVIAPPVITSVTPDIANPSASVTIAGANFNATSANNIVYFGATKGVITSASTTSLSVTLPFGATYGPLSVTDTVSRLAGYSGEYQGYAIVPFLEKYNNTAFINDTINFKPKFDLSVGLNPNIAAIADLDGDGRPDLISANTGAGATTTLTIYRNVSTTGSLSSSSFSSVGTLTTSATPTNVKVADLDGDGRPDIVASGYNNSVISVFLNTTTSSTITFTTKTDFSTVSSSTGNTPVVVAIADFDGDGKPDVVTSSGTTNYFSVLKNTFTLGSLSSGSFASPVTFATASGPVSITAGDFDGDGRPDVAVVCSTANAVSVFRNTATVGVINSGSFASRVDFSTAANPTDVVGADVDGNGKVDLVVTCSAADSFCVLRNTSSSGSLSFAGRVDFHTGSAPTGVAIADVNGDGKPDVVLTNFTASTVSVFRNTATSGSITTSSFANKIDLTTGTNGSGVNVGDLDGDGFPDIVTGNRGASTISILKNYPLPNIAPITGTMSVCSGSTTTLSDATTAGTTYWTSGSTSVATVGSSTGVVTGVAPGTSVITYTVVSGGDTNFVTATVTVNAGPSAGSITGTTTICPSATTTLSNTTYSGGTGVWSSSNASISTVDATTGVVTGVAPGTDTISFTVTSGTGCGTAATSIAFHVSSTPDPGVISGLATVCPGANITLSETVGGGTWSSGAMAVATVDASGVVHGLTAGTSIISYAVTSSCGTAYAVDTITVTATPPTPAAITGPTSVCVGSNITLSDTSAGGVWSSVTTSVATIDASGVVTGVAPGTSVISYTVTNSCGTAAATLTITVNPTSTVASITGTDSVCVGANTTLSDTTSGGVWSSVTTSVATVSASGVVHGVSAGTTTISYTITGCGTVAATRTVTVNPLPATPAAITGTTSLLVGQMTTLSDAVSGGAWTSLSTGVATIAGTTGIVTAVSAGSATISYTISNSCGANAVTAVITVSNTFAAGNLVVLQVNDTLSNAASLSLVEFSTAGGSAISTTTLPSSGTNRIVNSGSATSEGQMTLDAEHNHIIISGYDTSAGFAGVASAANINRVLYSVAPSMVGTRVRSLAQTLVYNTNNIRSATANGTNYYGSGTASTAGLGGVQLMNTSTATKITNTATVISNSRTVQIINGQLYVATGSGTAGVYAVGTGIPTATAASTIIHSGGSGASPYGFAISPDSNTLYMANDAVGIKKFTRSGGTGTFNYQYLLTSVAARGLTADFTTTPYTVYATTVAKYADSIIKISDAGAGSSVTVVSVAPFARIYRGITFAPANSAKISGTTAICSGASTTVSISGNPGDTVAYNIGGGSASTVVLTSAGTAIINTGALTNFTSSPTTTTYNLVSITTSMGTFAASGSAVITVNPYPIVGAVTGAATSVCVGSTISFSDTTGGGTWSVTNTSIATVDGSGVVTGVAAGTDTVRYGVTNSCGTTYSIVSITVNPLPNAGAITGVTSVFVGSTTTLADTAAGGTWTSSNTSIATVTSGGVVTGVSNGTDTITYSVSNGCGTANAIAIVTVTSTPFATIGGTASICAGSSTTITFTGTALATLTYNIDGGSDLTIVLDGSGSNYLVITPSATTTYNLTHITSGSYSAAITGASATVTVNPLPVAGTITGATSVCVGSTISLGDTASGGTWSSVFTSIATVVAGTGVVTGVSGGTDTIKYTVTSASCGSAVATYVITVNPLPTATIGGTTTIAAGSTATLTFGGTASATITYTINGGSPTTIGLSGGGAATLGVSPSITTTYAIVSVQSAAGCTQTISGQSAIITVNQPFTRGRLVVLKANGTTSNATGVSILQYDTSGTLQSTTAIPSTGSSQLTISGSATSEGMFSLSAEKDRLVLVGYDLASGTSGAAASTVNRVIGSMTPSGIFTRNYSKNVFSANNIRCGTSYDTFFMAVGANTGVMLMNNGTTNISSTSTNNRNLQIFNGQLYLGTGTGTPGAWSVGTGIPVTAGNTATAVATSGGSGTSPYGFSLSPDLHTLFLADDGAGIGIKKYTRAGTTGTFAYAYTVTTRNCRGLVVDYTTSPYIIYATTAGTGTADALIKVRDNGASSAVTVLDTSSTSGAGALRGVMFAPAVYASTAVTGPSAVCSGSSTTITITGNPYAKIKYHINSGSMLIDTLDYTGTGVLSTGALTTTAGSVSTATYTLDSITVPSGTTALSGSAVVTINPIPVIASITPSVTTLCIGASLSLTPVVVTEAGATLSYAWTGPNSFVSGSATPTFSPTTTAASGSYSLTATDVTTSCVSAPGYSAAITVNSLPNAGSISVTPTSLCSGATITLSETGTATGTGTFVSYNWSGPSGYSTTSTSTSVSTTASSAAYSGVYSLTVTYSDLGCTSTAVTSSAITVNTAPTAYSVTGGGNYCGATGVHVGLANSDTGVSYQLYLGGGTSGSAVAGTGSTLDFGALTSVGTYTVMATGAGGCTTNMTGSATITDHTVAITPGANPSVCQPISSASLSYSGASGSPTTYSITWDTAALTAGFSNVSGSSLGSSIPLVIPTGVAGVFTPSVTVSNGICTSVVYPVTLTVYGHPTAAITSAVAPCSGYATSIVFTGTSGASVAYSVDGGTTVNSVLTGGTFSLGTGALTSSHTYHLIDAHNAVCTTTVGVDTTITITPTPMQWVGGASGHENDWNYAGNWACGFVPGMTDSVIVPTSSHNPVISVATGNGTTASLQVNSGATVTVDSTAVLNVKGTFTNNGVITGKGTVKLNHTAAQRVKGKGYVYNLELNNSTGATIDTASRVTVKGSLTITAGNLATGDSLVLGADSVNTGRIATIPSSGASITGNVKVMDYVMGGRRAYRFISHPFSSYIPLSQIENYIDITGVGGSTNGFTTTGSNAASAFRYNTLRGNSGLSSDPGWAGFTSTYSTADSNRFHQYQGVRMFFRGALGEGLGYGSYTPSATTYSTWGPVNQGTQTIHLLKGTGSNQEYNLLGNPYPSATDLGTVAFNAKASGNIVGAAFYIWNAYAGTVGIFQPVPIGTTTATPYYLQTNGAFEVRAAHNNDSMVFTESNKNVLPSAILVKGLPQYATLHVYDANYHLFDMLHLNFTDASGEEEDNNMDAGKLQNPDFNFYSLSSDNHKLCIDARPYKAEKVIPLGVKSNYAQEYIIKAEAIVVPEGGKLYLHDKLLKQYTLLDQGTEYRFSVTKDTATQGENRFEISMDPSVIAVLANKGLEVSMTPNPATEDVKINYISGTKENVGIRVMDMSGVEVYNQDLGVQQSGSINIPVSSLSSGIYLVELTSGGRKVVQRLVKD